MSAPLIRMARHAVEQEARAVSETAPTIRPERPVDHEAVFEVNRLAFGGQDEARLVEALRPSPAFIPELSLVALEEERVVGHILFSRVAVRGEAATHDALALAPMAVLPRFGFIPGEPLGIRPPFEVSPGAFMVLELRPGALHGVRGEVRYPPEFAQV